MKLVWMLLTALLAGCIGEPIEEIQETPSIAVTGPVGAGDVGVNFDLQSYLDENRTNSDPYILLEGWASPGGNITTYSWTVPGSLFHPTEDRMVVEWLPLAQDAENLTSWMFNMGREGEIIASDLRTEAVMETSSATGSSVSLVAMDLEPSDSNFYDGELRASNPLVLSLSGVSDTEQAIGALIRFHPEGEPTTEGETFYGADVPTRFPASAAAPGFEYGVAAKLWSAGTETTVRIGNAVIDSSSTTDYGGVRELSANSEFEYDGISIIVTGYLATAGQGTWEATGSIQGYELDAGSIFINHGPLLEQEALILGAPVYGVIQDGTGGTTASYQVQVADVDVTTVVIHAEVHFGMRGSDLLGGPMQEEEIFLYSLLGPVPSYMDEPIRIQLL